ALRELVALGIGELEPDDVVAHLRRVVDDLTLGCRSTAGRVGAACLHRQILLGRGGAVVPREHDDCGDDDCSDEKNGNEWPDNTSSSLNHHCRRLPRRHVLESLSAGTPGSKVSGVNLM